MPTGITTMSYGVILQLHDVIFALGSCKHDVTNYLRTETAGGRKKYESCMSTKHCLATNQ